MESSEASETDFVFETFIDPGVSDFSVRTINSDELEFTWTIRAGDRYNLLVSSTLENEVQAWRILKPDVKPPLSMPWNSGEAETQFFTLETIPGL